MHVKTDWPDPPSERPFAPVQVLSAAVIGLAYLLRMVEMMNPEPAPLTLALTTEFIMPLLAGAWILLRTTPRNPVHKVIGRTAGG